MSDSNEELKETMGIEMECVRNEQRDAMQTREMTAVEAGIAHFVQD